MSTIVTRAGKGSPLTWNEVDNNFTNLNTDKYQSGSNVSLGTIAGTTITSSALTSGRVTFASTGGLLADSANLTFSGTTLSLNGLIRIDNGGNILGKSDNTGFPSIYGGGAYNSGAGIGLGGSSNSTLPNTILFTRGAYVESARIDSSGNLGIGTASPAVKLHAYSSGGEPARFESSLSYSLATVKSTSGSAFLGVSGDGGLLGTLSSTPLIFKPNDTERMRITSAGNVGIGTASPDVILTINKNQADGVKIRSANTNGTRLSLGVDTVAGITYIASSREGSGTYMPLAFYTSDLEGMRLDTSGNLSLRGGLALNTNQGPYWNGGVAYISYNNASNFMSFGAASAERMRIDSSGNLLVGTTSGGQKLVVKGDSGNAAAVFIASNSSVGFYTANTSGTGTYDGAQFLTNGGATAVGSISVTASSTAYVTSSDYRLKENIAPMIGALATVAQLKPVTYNWKSDGSDGQGFIAHELAEVVPDCVTGEKDATREEEYEISPAIPAVLDEEGNEVTPAVEAVMGTRIVPVYQGIDTSFLVATLTAAIQEQQAMIDELKAKVAALEAA